MRPHKLVMKNFGPFLDETIDFDKLGDGVYLILGDTAIGKTMIYDALSIGLFGQAGSDKRQNVSVDMFYNKTIEKDEKGYRPPMIIDLTFSQNGREYHVNREMTWGSSGRAVTPSWASQLFIDGVDKTGEQGDHSVFSKGCVTSAIVSDIGLGAADFKKIIMLAQGEFQRFLESSGAKRNEILGNLYDNSDHIRLENRLKKAEARLSKKIEEIDSSMKRAKDASHIPDDIGQDILEKLTFPIVDKKDFFDAYDRVIAANQKTFDEVEQLIKDNESKIENLGKDYSKGENNNKLLQDKKDIEAKIVKADDLKDDYKLLEILIDNVTRAAKIMPYEKKVEEANSGLKNSRNEGIAMAQKLELLEADSKKQKSIVDEIEKESLPKIDILKDENARINHMISKYDDLESALKASKASKQEYDKIKYDYEDVVKRLNSVVESQKANDNLLTSLSEAGEEAVKRAQDIMNNLSQRKEELYNISSLINKINEDDQKFIECEKALIQAEAKTSEARKNYDDARIRLNHGRAGALAKEMIKELEETNKAVCPVCGVVHTWEDADNFASVDEETLTNEEVERIYKLFTDLSEKEQKLHTTCNNMKTDLENRKFHVVDNTVKLLNTNDGIDWNNIANGQMIGDAINYYENEYGKAVTNYNNAVGNRDQKIKAANEKVTLQNSYNDLSAKEKVLQNQLNIKNNECITNNNNVENAKKDLAGFPENKDIALNKINTNNEQIKAIEDSYKQASDKFKKISEEIVSLNGKIGENKKNTQVREADLTSFTEDFNKQLKVYGFSDIDAYKNALIPKGRTEAFADVEEAEGWIEKYTGSLDKYNKAVINLNSKLEEYQKLTQGLKEVDLSEIQNNINTCKAKKDELKKQRDVAKNNLDDTESSKTAIEKCLKDKEKFRRIEMELKPMVENNCSSRYHFKDYVLADYFNEIVSKASVYFEELMDGEYHLETRVHRNKSDKKGEEPRDLDIVCVDNDGKENVVALLSGGQTFEASLSLALGLSEVTQMKKNGRVRIDSMFIDEGFGTLDRKRLDNSMNVLSGLTTEDRQIGIITHVEALMESDLYKRLEVTKIKDGVSTIVPGEDNE
ncbi:MAG: SMC family ATPase [Eubacterium sp.]|nr:SMC family ATPase [Eubacterium sp.]